VRWKQQPVAHAKQIARYYLAKKGWTDQFWAIDYIVSRESSWDVCAHYPSSHQCGYQGENACGIPQANPCSSMAFVGGDYRWNADTQLRWMILFYIPNKSTLRTPIGAYRYWVAHRYY
jgi:hypothetical protein